MLHRLLFMEPEIMEILYFGVCIMKDIMPKYPVLPFRRIRPKVYWVNGKYWR